MKYYKVNKSGDQKTIYNIYTRRIITTLLLNELYTEHELIKKHLNVNLDYFDVIYISKKKTYYFFGARFQTALNY